MSNRPVTSREYKLMLNVDRFEDREQASCRVKVEARACLMLTAERFGRGP